MSAVFDAYAAYYDLLYQDKDYNAETNFAHELLAKHGVAKQGSLLELGCGTGKHAEGFARLGYSLHGVDMSPGMVDAANARKPADVAKQLQFVVGDVRDLRVDQLFDAVISLFHVASYQTTNADLMAMFKTAATHLKPGGVFLFDCWYGPAVLTDRPVVRVKRIRNATVEVLRIAEPMMYPNENRVDVHYTVQVKQKGGAERLIELTEKHSIRYLFSPEVELMLELAGFSKINRQGWMTESPTGFDSWAATFVAIKE
jgi:SAM-dependent methyltransferase